MSDIDELGMEGLGSWPRHSAAMMGEGWAFARLKEINWQGGEGKLIHAFAQADYLNGRFVQIS